MKLKLEIVVDTGHLKSTRLNDIIIDTNDQHLDGDTIELYPYTITLRKGFL
jgi:hypothetical protein